MYSVLVLLKWASVSKQESSAWLSSVHVYSNFIWNPWTQEEAQFKENFLGWDDENSYSKPWEACIFLFNIMRCLCTFNQGLTFESAKLWHWLCKSLYFASNSLLALLIDSNLSFAAWRSLYSKYDSQLVSPFWVNLSESSPKTAFFLHQLPSRSSRESKKYNLWSTQHVSVGVD